MEVSRTDLDDIWENRPYGFMKEYIKRHKKNKNNKKFIVTTIMRKTTIVDKIEQEVWALNDRSAQNLALDSNVRALRNKHNVDRWDSTISYSTIAKEVR
jgi:hypothetical protein